MTPALRAYGPRTGIGIGSACGDQMGATRQLRGVSQATVLAKSAPVNTSTTDSAANEQRIRDMVESQYDFIWRSLRRMGVADADTADATQQVLVTATRKD